MRWDRLSLGVGLSYALFSWSLSYGAVLPQLRDDLHISASVAAIHGSMFGVLLLLLAAVGRRSIAATSNRTLLRLTVVCMTAGGIMFAFGRSIAMTLPGAALGSAGAALFVIVAPAVIYAHQTTSRRRRWRP